MRILQGLLGRSHGFRNSRTTRVLKRARNQRKFLALESLEGRQLLAVAPVGHLIEGNAGTYQVPTNGNTFTAASVTQGVLPTGLTLSSTGLISGTPAAGTQGTSSLTVQVTPTVGSPYDQELTLTILADQFVDPSPSANNGFGNAIVVLSNGNVVVTAPYDDAGGTDAGAVYLFSGSTGALISTLTGSSANNNVGSGGITALSNGNYVIRSPNWSNGTATNVGAVTWGSGTAGVTGVVSSANSLVGSTVLEQVGSSGSVGALSNGNYLVQSKNWSNGTITSAGAVTWGSGTAGVTGVISSANSLVGSTASDQVGVTGVTFLSNGNYVVLSPSWDNGTVTNAGAVTWGSGTAGVTGVISSANSLVGSRADDAVGSSGLTALDNGNYVVRSTYWDNGTVTDAGAVTWGSGTAGVTGVVSSANSLVGSRSSDFVGATGVTALSNGNYVVRSQNWDNGTIANASAVTWGSGTAGVTGEVSGWNSLVGPFELMTLTINPVTKTFLMAMKSPTVLATRSLLPLSSTTVTSSANPSTPGSSVKFTATVTSGATGTVQFYDGATALGSPVTISNSTATYTTSALTAGSHSITAVYSGDASYAGSTSSALSQTVNRPPTVTTQPTSASALPSNTVVLSAAAIGSPTPTVQWQIQTGEGWVNVEGATANSLGVVVSAGMPARQYRAIFTNGLAIAISDTATVSAAVEVTSQIRAVRSGLVLNRTTGLFTGTITLTNTGTSALAALSMLLSGLSADVTLTNADGSVSDGTSYLNTGPLAAGRSVTLRLSFRKVSVATVVNYTPRLFLQP